MTRSPALSSTPWAWAWTPSPPSRRAFWPAGANNRRSERTRLVLDTHEVALLGCGVEEAGVLGAEGGVEDDRAAVVVEHLRGVGELHRDDVVVGVAGLEVAGDKREVVPTTRAGVHDELRRPGAIALRRRLLHDLVLRHGLGSLEAPYPDLGERLGEVSVVLVEDPRRGA